MNENEKKDENNYKQVDFANKVAKARFEKIWSEMGPEASAKRTNNTQIFPPDLVEYMKDMSFTAYVIGVNDCMLDMKNIFGEFASKGQN